MKVKLDSIDVLQIAKAMKSGWLDLDKVEAFKSLAEGYNPPKEISPRELRYYKDCLFKGWGYTPTDEATMKAMMLEGLDEDTLKKWEKSIEQGRAYSMMVRQAFLGLVAIKALGGTFEDVNPDLSFIDEGVPKF